MLNGESQTQALVANLRNPSNNGDGIFTQTRVYICTGEWESDEMHGMGEYSYADGSVYNGATSSNRVLL